MRTLDLLQKVESIKVRGAWNNGVVCTGKPSDNCCITWSYDNIEAAEFTAKEYFDNRTNFLK